MGSSTGFHSYRDALRVELGVSLHVPSGAKRAVEKALGRLMDEAWGWFGAHDITALIREEHRSSCPDSIILEAILRP